MDTKEKIKELVKKYNNKNNGLFIDYGNHPYEGGYSDCLGMVIDDLENF